MKPRIIRSEKDYEKALAYVDSLMSARAGTPEMDELELWTLLVQAYEDKHYPIDPPDPIAAIQFRMEQQGLKQADLAPYIGSKSKVSEVLSGRRSLSISMIRKLHDGLGIPAEILIGEPQKEQGKTKTSNARTQSARRARPATTPSRSGAKDKRNAATGQADRVAEPKTPYGHAREKQKSQTGQDAKSAQSKGRSRAKSKE